jgi:hypothetical protein
MHAAKGIQALVKHWRMCIEHSRVYVEKLQTCTKPICTKLAGKQILRFSFYSPM